MVIKTRQKHRVGSDITSDEVRLIGVEGEQIGVMSLASALAAAKEASVGAEVELQVVELQPNAKPPVCRLMDYGRFLFQLKKKQAEAKKKQKQVQVKELKYRPGIEEGDYQVKLRNLTRFLEHGDKVKITMRFRGREMSHQEIGMAMMQRILKDIEGFAIVEQPPKMEGRQVIMVVAPGKSK